MPKLRIMKPKPLIKPTKNPASTWWEQENDQEMVEGVENGYLGVFAFVLEGPHAAVGSSGRSDRHSSS